MTTNQLKYFITAAECLNFTEAGKRHFISQTAITQHIQALEEDLGVKLFLRQKRRVELTPAGRVFLTEAIQILERNKSAVEKVRKAAEGMTGTIRIGYVKGQENRNLGSLLRDFYNANPSIVFEVFRHAHLDLLLKLDRGDLDIAINIVYEATDLSGFETMPLSSQRLYAVLPAGHSYAGLSAVSRYDLRNERFLLTKFYDNPDAKKYNSLLPEQFATSGFVPKIAGQSSDIETLLLLVEAGVGLTILPESAIDGSRANQNLVFIPLIGVHEQIHVVAIWKKENTNPVLPLFLNHCR